MKTFFLVVLCLLSYGHTPAQNKTLNSFTKTVFERCLSYNKTYDDLSYISNRIGSRLPGARGEAKMIDYLKERLDTLTTAVKTKTYSDLQWIRETPARAYLITADDKRQSIKAKAAIGSGPTRAAGTEASLIAVQNLKGFKAMTKTRVSGKFVLVDQSLPADHINLFPSYQELREQRDDFVQVASQKRASGVLFRSPGFDYAGEPRSDRVYFEGETTIPVAFLNPEETDYLTTMIDLNPKTRFSLSMNCRFEKNSKRRVVRGIIEGSSTSDKTIVLKAQLNSSDLGDGIQKAVPAAQFINVMALFKELDYSPKHDIELISEPSLTEKNDQLAAEITDFFDLNSASAIIENKQGGEMPIGINFPDKKRWKNAKTRVKNALKRYGINHFPEGTASGNNFKIITNSQRYVDIVKSENDDLKKINKRELATGTATLAVLIYVLDHQME